MQLNDKIRGASKWSLVTEVVSRIMGPLTNMVLARLLAPEAFGMVATITMITSFADIFTDAGFQKYLVQGEFLNEEDLNNNTNVAFWTNLGLSVVLWLVIYVFRHNLASMVGNDGLGDAIAIASLSLPMTSFSSIQMARFRRELDFRTLFYAKLVGIFVPLAVTIPLAFALRNFWALIFGTLCVHLSNAVLLTLHSRWKPSFFYRISILKSMISFSIWTLIEQLLGWANLNIGIFIVGQYLTAYYLGLYKTSMSVSNQLLSIITNALSPVILSSLSKVKNDEKKFQSMFFSFEEKISLIVLPLGVGMFVFKDVFTNIFLGSQWGEAVDFIGIWGLMRSLLIVFGMFSMEVFVAKGKPQYSVFSQALSIAVLVPTILVSAPFGYRTLYISRTLIVGVTIVIKLILLTYFAKISAIKLLKCCFPFVAASFCMGVFGFILKTLWKSLLWELVSVLICVIFYFSFLLLFARTRKVLFDFLKEIKE